MPQVMQIRALGTILWNAGLPVLDDLHNFSYDWKVPDSLSTTNPTPSSDNRLEKWRTAKYIDALSTLQPGVTMMIMHCSDAGAHFAHISDSGPLRRGDMLAMLDPAFAKAIRDQGIIAHDLARTDAPPGPKRSLTRHPRRTIVIVTGNRS